MSEKELEKPAEELSDEQLEGASGGLSERFKDARQQNLDSSAVPDEGELPDDQLKGVAGGLSERFKDAQQQNLDSSLSDTFDDARKRSLNQ